MQTKYKNTIGFFLVLYLLPIAILWVFVTQRIETRQSTLQLFLQNQLDVDRQIVAERQRLREIQPQFRTALLKTVSRAEMTSLTEELRLDKDRIAKFWQRYETTYTGNQRPFLKEVLQETQETQLLEEEAEYVRRIIRDTDAYANVIESFVKAYSPETISAQEAGIFLEGLDVRRDAIIVNINNLTDVRYIFAQRAIFFASGENDRQAGLLTSVFVVLIATTFVITTMQFFLIHRPMGDIMAFLRDMKEGKRGQRLYFSSIVKEIKESEDIINEFVAKAEAHEKE